MDPHDERGPERRLHPLSRRAFLVGSASLPFLTAGCGENDDNVLASAARGSSRLTFLDSVAWIDFDGISATIAFTPFRLTDANRQAIIADRSVFPAIPGRDPMLELRLELKPGTTQNDLQITANTLAAIQLTFWNFDDPPPVVRVERDSWSAPPDIVVPRLEGEMRRGGWAIGTIRGQKVQADLGGRNNVFTWNLNFQSSLA